MVVAAKVKQNVKYYNMEFFYTGENPILIRASKEAAGLDVTVDHVEHVSDNYKIVHIDLAIEYPEGI
jgi:hypothetical protein